MRFLKLAFVELSLWMRKECILRMLHFADLAHTHADISETAPFHREPKTSGFQSMSTGSLGMMTMSTRTFQGTS